jgi:hypothetical protein
MSSLSSPVARSLDTALANPAAVLNMPPARLAEALRASLKHLSPQAAQEISDVLSLSAPEAQLSVDKGSLLTEQKQRANNQIAGLEITLGNSPAIEMHVSVNGKIIRAVLSDASFDKSRTDQGSYAQGLGGRLATREENRAVVNDLLEKEENGDLNPAETKLLKTYRKKFVRDSEGGLVVDGRRVYVYGDLNAYDYPSNGVLVVLPLAESK